jgi:hypothetical protein
MIPPVFQMSLRYFSTDITVRTVNSEEFYNSGEVGSIKRWEN